VGSILSSPIDSGQMDKIKFLHIKID